jgi:hypothetical protein
MDNVKDVADKAASVVDKGVSEAVQVATHTAQDLLARGSEMWDTAKVCAIPKACAVDRSAAEPFDSTAAGLGALRRQQGLVKGSRCYWWGVRSLQYRAATVHAACFSSELLKYHRDVNNGKTTVKLQALHSS